MPGRASPPAPSTTSIFFISAMEFSSWISTCLTWHGVLRRAVEQRLEGEAQAFEQLRRRKVLSRCDGNDAPLPFHAARVVEDSPGGFPRITLRPETRQECKAQVNVLE